MIEGDVSFNYCIRDEGCGDWSNTFYTATWGPEWVRTLTRIWRIHFASVQSLRLRRELHETNWSRRKMWNPTWLQCCRWPSPAIQYFEMLAVSSLRPIEWNDFQHPLDHGIRMRRPKTCHRPQIDCSHPFRSHPSSMDSDHSWNRLQRLHTLMCRTCHRRTFPFDSTSSELSEWMDAEAMVELLTAAREPVPPESGHFPAVAVVRTPLARRPTHFGNSRTSSFCFDVVSKNRDYVTHTRTHH